MASIFLSSWTKTASNKIGNIIRCLTFGGENKIAEIFIPGNHYKIIEQLCHIEQLMILYCYLFLELCFTRQAEYE